MADDQLRKLFEERPELIERAIEAAAERLVERMLEERRDELDELLEVVVRKVAAKRSSREYIECCMAAENDKMTKWLGDVARDESRRAIGQTIFNFHRDHHVLEQRIKQLEERIAKPDEDDWWKRGDAEP